MNFLFLTAHDYRTPRRASLHFIAKGLTTHGKVRFFSLRYSLLSKWKADPRLVLDEKANQVDTFEGVECYLWKSWLHPINLKFAFLKFAEALLYALYVACVPRVLKKWIAEADTVFVESGTAVVFYHLIRKTNPRARVVYICSDLLESINCARYVRDVLYRTSPGYDACLLCSRQMKEDFKPGSRLYFVPHGIDPSLSVAATSPPYGKGVHAVSVGSMLFDPGFFEVAGRNFSHITFHVIGCGMERSSSWPQNVRHYGEMKFSDTIPYVKFAAIGIAPYDGKRVPASLADTSMKLMQYAFFGVPAVCPIEAAGDYPRRFGYKTGDEASIVAAVKAASEAGKATEASRLLTWGEVTARVIDPAVYPDTAM